VAVAPTLVVALVALVVLGVANIVVNTLARTFLLHLADPGMHGRVMAIHALVFLGSTPIGGPLVGWLCSVWGARSGMLVASAGCLVAAAVVLPATRSARAEEVTETSQAQGSASPSSSV
jgi:predicted MFS family arabinose efflux permease